MPSAFVPCGQHGWKRVLAKCGKGSLLRGVERFEQAIGRVHGRRLLLHRLAKQADKQQKYKPPKAICQPPQRRPAQGRLGVGHGLPPVPLDGLIGDAGGGRATRVFEWLWSLATWLFSGAWRGGGRCDLGAR